VAEIPVTVHEQALDALLPARCTIQQALCVSLPKAGNLGVTEINEFIPRINIQTQAVVAAVEAFGKKVGHWRRHSDTRKLVNSAWNCAQAFQLFAELRRDPLLMHAEYDIRQCFLAVIDRVLRDILEWLERYESVVRHPEAWQGKNAHLMLVIEAEEELNALNHFLEGRGYALYNGTFVPGSHQSHRVGPS